MPVFPATAIPEDAPGQLITDDGQYEYNGLLMGAGTNILVEKVEGLLSMPDLTRNDTDRKDRHGSWGGRHLMTGREISFDVQVLYDEGGTRHEIEPILEQLGEVFYPDDVLKPFVYKRWGQVKRMLWAKPTERDFDSDYKVAMGLAGGSLQLFCPDPTIYSTIEYEASASLGPGQTSGSLTVDQGGRVPTRKAIITITGPCTDPTVANETDDNRQVKIEGAFNALDTIVINMDTWSVTVNGADATGMVTPDSEFWELLKGNNEITYDRSPGNTGADSTIDVVFRKAWI